MSIVPYMRHADPERPFLHARTARERTVQPPPAGPAVWLALIMVAVLATPLVLAAVLVLESRARQVHPPIPSVSL